MAVGKKARGSIKNSMTILLKEVLKRFESIVPELIMITHTEALEQPNTQKQFLKRQTTSKGFMRPKLAASFPHTAARVPPAFYIL